MFADTGLQITQHGQRHLGAVIGSLSFRESYVEHKIDNWIEIKILSSIARSHPHAAMVAFTHGLVNKWQYLMRTIDGIKHLFDPLEDAIKFHLIPALTNQEPPSQLVRELLHLPTRHGGLGIINPSTICEDQYGNSQHISNPLKQMIIGHQNTSQVLDTAECKSHVHDERRKGLIAKAKEVRESLPAILQRAMDLASETDASSWLASLPIIDHGFYLNKGEFYDAISIRYRWSLMNTPGTCTFGLPFSIDHAMICLHGGMTIRRHNDIRDLTGKWLKEVCHDVECEPHLQFLSGEQIHPNSANLNDDARTDIRARGFWRRGKCAFFDVRVFHPNAQSYRSSKIETLYRRHENLKKREYGDRIREVENGSFTPLVFATTGGLSRETTIFYKRLAELMSISRNAKYHETISWMRRKLSFSLVKSAIMCR